MVRQPANHLGGIWGNDLVSGAIGVPLEHGAMLAHQHAAPKPAVQAGPVHDEGVLDVVPALEAIQVQEAQNSDMHVQSPS